MIIFKGAKTGIIRAGCESEQQKYIEKTDNNVDKTEIATYYNDIKLISYC